MQNGFATALKKAGLWLGLILSVVCILDTLGELVFVRDFDPADCKGAAVMGAILVVTGSLCWRGLRRMEQRP
jgi:hypothetical protein